MLTTSALSSTVDATTGAEAVLRDDGGNYNQVQWSPDGSRIAWTAVEEAGGGLVLPCDVTDPQQVEGAVARVVAEWGRLDLLFNNAGRGFKAATIDETPVEEWLDVVAVNLTGSFLCARAAFA